MTFSVKQYMQIATSKLATGACLLTLLLFTGSQAAVVKWVGSSGDWGDAAHWSGGAVPGANDDVVIDTSNSDITVTVSTGNNQVDSVVCQETLQLNGGTLAPATFLQVWKNLMLNGGTIAGGAVVTTNGAALVVNTGTLDGVTINGDLDVGRTVNGGTLTMADGLVLNGTMWLGNPGNGNWGRVDFGGNQVLGGNGTVVFGAVTDTRFNTIRASAGGSTLVIGTGVTMHGQTGNIGYSAYFGGPGDAKIINQGTIAADVSGGTIAIFGNEFDNQGLLAMKAGGIVAPNALTNMNLGSLVVDTGVLTLGSTFIQQSGTLDFGLNGTNDFGQAQINGPAVLGGVLRAHLGTGFIPDIGDSFSVLKYGTNTLSFTKLDLPLSSVWQTNAQNGILSLVVTGVLPFGVSIAPTNQILRPGDTLSLQAAASGPGPITYQWQQNGHALLGATNAQFVLNSVTVDATGTYQVLVTNPGGSLLSDGAQVQVLSCPGLPAGIVAFWRGEGNTSDYAGTNDAVFNGAASYVPGEVGEAFTFDGVSSYLAVPNSPLWDLGTSDFSVEFWVNFSQIPSSTPVGDSSGVFIAHDEGGGVRNKWLLGLGGGLLYLYVNGPAIGSHLLAQSAFNPTTNQWYHLALTRQTEVYRLFSDGQVLSTQTNAISIPAANAPLTIGAAQDLFFSGMLDEISFYNRALTPAEVSSIYQAGSSGKCVGQPAPIRLSVVSVSKAGTTLRMEGGETGTAFVIQATEDLAIWTDVGEINKTQALDTFTDPVSLRKRFYRVESKP
jgi:hypothetical protein